MSTKSSNPKRKNSPSAFKQGTLSFASSKRTSCATGSHKTKKNSQAKANIPRTLTAAESSSEDIDIEDIHVTSSEEDAIIEDEKEERAPKPAPLLRTRQERSSQAKKPTTTVLQSKVNEENIQNSRVELNDKDPKWRKHYAVVREKMGHLHPIHAEGQSKIHEILRVFDMSYEYGPCVGVTRLERWERASALGLNPPDEVREILSTRQGTEEATFSQSVLYNEV